MDLAEGSGSSGQLDRKSGKQELNGGGGMSSQAFWSLPLRYEASAVRDKRPTFRDPLQIEGRSLSTSKLEAFSTYSSLLWRIVKHKDIDVEPRVRVDQSSWDPRVARPGLVELAFKHLELVDAQELPLAIAKPREYRGVDADVCVRVVQDHGLVSIRTQECTTVDPVQEAVVLKGVVDGPHEPDKDMLDVGPREAALRVEVVTLDVDVRQLFAVPILATLRSEGKIAIAVASSGIAATLLTDGRTAHLMLKIPLQVTNESVCAIPKQSHLAELIRQASLTIWDESPMTRRFSYEALDRALRDLMSNDDEPFGGKVMVLSGDFRQILPVVKRAGTAETVDACLKSSALWQHFEQLRLTDNMRVLTAPDQQSSEELAVFLSLLLQVGEGRHEKNPALGSEFMKIPQDMLTNEPEEELVPSFRVLPSDDAAGQDGNNSDDDEDEAPFEEPSELSKIVESVYGDLNLHSRSDSYFAERAILTPTNSDAHRISDEVTKKL